MKKKILITTIGTITILVVIATILIISTQQNGNTYHPTNTTNVPLVLVEPVSYHPVTLKEEYTGEAVAVNHVTISPKVNGMITFCPWRDGDLVKPGDVLIRIDEQEYQIQLDSRKAALDVANAQYQDLLNSVRKEDILKTQIAANRLHEEYTYYENYYKKLRDLNFGKSFSQDEIDKAYLQFVNKKAEYLSTLEQLTLLTNTPSATQIEVHKALIQQSFVNVQSAEMSLKDCIIPSPIGGQVSKVLVQQGDQARIGMNLLEIVDSTSTVIQFFIPEGLAQQVDVGTPIEYSTDSSRQDVYTSKIIRKYPTINSDTRTAIVEAAIDPTLKILPGMFVRISVILKYKDRVLAIPEKAISLSPEGESYVFVAHENKAIIKIIEKGILDRSNREIIKGLLEGDQLIVEGKELLKDGVTIRIAEK